MTESPKIPIKNIYYMLCYAWNTLQQADDQITGIEEFDNIYNLLAKVMVSGINNLRKRGFHREYKEYCEELSLVRGKIDVGKTIKRQSLKRRKVICDFDEFTNNVPFNQILKTTLSTLIKYPQLDRVLKNELIKTRYHFSDIDEIRLTNNSFSFLKYNRNNIHYKMLMNICELLYYGLITNEKGNAVRFADFIRNEQMAILYEKFVLNFYKKHLPRRDFTVHSPKISWSISSEYNHIGLEYLPEMRTDIVLEDNINQTQLIIDTKFYRSAFGKRNYSETNKLISSNLYQIYTYINSSDFHGAITGMLLYPTNGEELDLEYLISGKIILVKTLNLSSNWEDIFSRLIEIANIRRY
ncbi:5-methylcytosine-specific restriction endonuclease system specificity protein McrC [Desulfosporosinus metallidurans]|uniref:McrBC 5-methylcytosine restriction system component n=1 Tax=Desulfosporosinus metallidurans TaxID=1888891 RepID=A0A1Q8QNS8_9FIRM|nr:5-methylcytosine-specific restriction endonuclease system specificity protein McrC [Desulfosporosinus metallidurans]OLN28970.1 McrBC 5-methylcytosine restriction system component [Desulfosporosinus metallidurans]